MTIIKRDAMLSPLASAIFALVLAGCNASGTIFSGMPGPVSTSTILGTVPAPVIRQPVLPEYLVGCRGHVLVPALGMTFVFKGGTAPISGQYLREERLTAPYRVVRPGDRMSQEHSAQRLNVELDNFGRIVGLACG